MSATQPENNSFSDIYKRLSHALVERERNIALITESFRGLQTNCQRVDFAHKLLTEYKLCPQVVVANKSQEVAQKYREDGNCFFKSKQHGLALIAYNKSIANAPLNSNELALAYANRSAVLYEQSLYCECLRDITLAVSHNYPNHEKLLQRKQKAELHLKNQDVQEKYYEELPQLTYSSHPNIKCGSDCIEIKITQSLGRHVVASRNIQVGDVIAIERPFTQILLKDNYLTHCYECLMPSYNLIPCKNCVSILFCSTTCIDKSYHKHECSILGTLLSMNVNNLELIALKISMVVDNQECNNDDSFYKTERYTEIHNLLANTHMRTVSDLFGRACTAAVIFELMKNYTKFFIHKEHKCEDVFKELLLLHMQTGPTNFHEISELRKIKHWKVTEVGSGAFAFLSLLNHSCSPNVVRHCHGNAIVLRALRPISKGQQLFDNYGYHHSLMPKNDRQKYLTQQYYFHCTCEACNEDWPLFHDQRLMNFPTFISDSEMELLGAGSRTIVKQVLEKCEPIVADLENSIPCVELSNGQEIIKQCYALLGNRRIPL